MMIDTTQMDLALDDTIGRIVDEIEESLVSNLTEILDVPIGTLSLDTAIQFLDSLDTCAKDSADGSLDTCADMIVWNIGNFRILGNYIDDGTQETKDTLYAYYVEWCLGPDKAYDGFSLVAKSEGKSRLWAANNSYETLVRGWRMARMVKKVKLTSLHTVGLQGKSLMEFPRGETNPYRKK